jgi:hypothetical protein
MTKQIALTLDIAQEAKKQGLQGANNYAKADGGIGIFIGNLLSVVMMAGALLTLFFLIIGAIEWITSGGDSGKLEKARNKITNAVIGLVVLAASLAIFILVEKILEIDFLNFV